MSRCPESVLVQDFLDGELAAAEARVFRAHLEHCAHCSGEVALYRRAFACLDRLPLATPSPALAERILDRVVPRRVRRRWIATFGWAYAGALAACLTAALAWISQPGARAFLTAASGEFSSRLVHAVVLGLNVLSFAVLSLGQGWGAVTTIGGRFVPLARALAAPFANPFILVSLAAATISCAALMWWLRPREAGPDRPMRHLGVLGL